MSKERLEFKELDEHFKPKTELGEFMKKEVDNGNHCDGNVYWLISEKERQAERVQELEKDIKEWEIVNECWEEINENLAKQNKRYREALEKIVHQENLKEINVFGYDHEDISSYVEEVARQALESEE